MIKTCQSAMMVFTVAVFGAACGWSVDKTKVRRLYRAGQNMEGLAAFKDGETVRRQQLEAAENRCESTGGRLRAYYGETFVANSARYAGPFSTTRQSADRMSNHRMPNSPPPHTGRLPEADSHEL